MFPICRPRHTMHGKALVWTVAFNLALSVFAIETVFAAPAAPSSINDSSVPAASLARAQKIDRQHQQLQKKFVQGSTQTLRVVVQVKQIAAKKSLRNANVIEHIKAPDHAAWTKLQKFIAANQIKLMRQIDRSGLVSLELNQKQLNNLVKSNQLEFLSEDQLFYPSLNKSIPFINADMVRAAGFTGAGQAVAILDSGVQSNHEFLQGRIVEEACFSSGDGVNTFSLCPNGEQRQFGPGSGRDCKDRYDIHHCGHGTHIAGVAAGFFASDFYGVASQADIVSVQVFTVTSPAATRLGAFTSDLIAALDWLINDAQTANIAAVNMSFGSGKHTDYCDASPLAELIQVLRSQGIATVIATGNNGYNGAINWPACISSAISVGATFKESDTIPSLSNTNHTVDLAAPGISVLSSVADPTSIRQYQNNSGTSVAAAHVSGAFAVLKSVNPNASVQQIESTLKSTGMPTLDPGIDVSVPRIDLFAAYNEMLSLPSEPPIDNCTDIPGLVSHSVGEISNQSQKYWPAYVSQGGLFRIHLTSTASSGSFAVMVGLGSAYSTVSIAAGGSTFVDIPNISAGQHTLSVRAVTSGVSLGSLRVEQLVTQGPIIAGTCVEPSSGVPGIVTTNAGDIPQDSTKSWVIDKKDVRHVRIQITSTSTLNSRQIVVTLNNVPVTISIDANQTTFVDYALVNTDIVTLLIKANTAGVSIGKIEALAY